MKTIYWDACAFHALFGDEPGRVDVCRNIIGAALRNELLIYTSAITSVEVVWIKNLDRLSPEHEEKIQKFFEHKFIKIVSCDRGMAAESRRLLWRYPKLHPKDAIHVASALSLPVDVMHTYDDKHLTPLSEQLGNPPLRICHPEYMEPPEPHKPSPELPLPKS